MKAITLYPPYLIESSGSTDFKVELRNESKVNVKDQKEVSQKACESGRVANRNLYISNQQ